MSELLDVYDDSMHHLGILSREEAHRTGAWHKTFHCWIIRQEGGRSYVLFQRRSSTKKAHPNKLDITAAGHIAAGETVEEGVREIGEELGAQIDASALHFLGIRTAASISGEGINREFNHVFLLHRDNPISSYKLQLEEVAGLVQIEVQDGLDLCAGRRASVPASGVQLQPGGYTEPMEIQVPLDDIIPRRDKYYMKIFMMAQRYFEGNPDICI